MRVTIGKEFALRKNMTEDSLIIILTQKNGRHYFGGERCEYRKGSRLRAKDTDWIPQRQGPLSTKTPVENSTTWHEVTPEEHPLFREGDYYKCDAWRMGGIDPNGVVKIKVSKGFRYSEDGEFEKPNIVENENLTCYKGEGWWYGWNYDMSKDYCPFKEGSNYTRHIECKYIGANPDTFDPRWNKQAGERYIHLAT